MPNDFFFLFLFFFFFYNFTQYIVFFQLCNKEMMMSYIEMNKMSKLIQCMDCL